jgi:hypothetical protein
MRLDPVMKVQMWREKTILPPFQNKSYFWTQTALRNKVTFGEISLKLCETYWNVATINVNVVVDELPSQITIYTCSMTDIWTPRCRHTSTRFYV